MAALSNSSASAILKQLYTDQVVLNMSLQDNPLLALIKKKPNSGGANFPQPVIVEASLGGASPTFSNAQANQSPVVSYQFLITRTTGYSIATITNELMKSAGGSAESFVNATSMFIDNAILSASKMLATGLYRSGTGSMGQASSYNSVATGVVQLTNVSDIENFGLNQPIQANPGDGGNSPRALTGYIVAINRDLGQFTVAGTQGGAPSGGLGWGNSDYLSILGSLNMQVKGLAGWLPFTDPVSGDNWFGVDRSVDRTRLAGIVYDGSGIPVRETVVQATMRGGRGGAYPDTGFCTFETYSGLELELGSQAQYDTMKGPAELAFEGIKVNGAKKKLTIVPDKNQAALTMHLLSMDSLYLLHLDNEIPAIERYGDGLEMLRVANSDASELRVGYYAQMGFSGPGRNIAVKTST